MNRKQLISAIVTLLLLVSIPLTYLLAVKRPQDIRTEAAPETVLWVSPASITKEIDDTFEVQIQIATGSNQVFGVDLYLSFDPQVLEARDIISGGFFPDPQQLAKNIDNQTGNIVYSLGSLASQQGTGAAATIGFEAKAAGTSSISFEAGTSVAAANEAEGLKSKTGGLVTVTGGGSETHQECVGEQCREVSGAGSDECQTDDQCIETHFECQNLQCVEVSGPGDDSCQSDSTCYFYDCNDQRQCVKFAGNSADQCLTDPDCADGEDNGSGDDDSDDSEDNGGGTGSTGGGDLTNDSSTSDDSGTDSGSEVPQTAGKANGLLLNLVFGSLLLLSGLFLSHRLRI